MSHTFIMYDNEEYVSTRLLLQERNKHRAEMEKLMKKMSLIKGINDEDLEIYKEFDR